MIVREAVLEALRAFQTRRHYRRTLTSEMLTSDISWHTEHIHDPLPTRTGFQREYEARLRLFRPAVDVMRHLAFSRSIRKSSLMASAIEGVAQVWCQFPSDEVLYLRRCEDPADRHASIEPRSTAQKHLWWWPTTDERAKLHVRNLVASVTAAWDDGIHPEVIRDSVSKILEILEEENELP